ncbi:MAG TPA: GNAT family N-acetyltransferase [Ktedonobacteraceae bacterium]|nr:GNAT family N-acetyltransferase [Ktedonobacteraceae bacterium]
MQPPTEPTTLNASQVNTASQLLGRAFQDDPLMIYLTPNASRRARLLPSLFRVVLSYCLRYGVVYTTPDLAGVACCLPPGQTSLTIGRLALISMRHIPGRLGPAGLWRFLYASHYADKIHNQTAPGTHWYLWVLGTEPHEQGHGVGGAFLQSVIQQASIQHLPCYLETENPRNVGFYQHHGFRLISEVIVKNSNLHVYAMLWEPA